MVSRLQQAAVILHACGGREPRHSNDIMRKDRNKGLYAKNYEAEKLMNNEKPRMAKESSVGKPSSSSEQMQADRASPGRKRSLPSDEKIR